MNRVKFVKLAGSALVSAAITATVGLIALPGRDQHPLRPARSGLAARCGGRAARCGGPVLPAGALGPVAAALARNDPAYRIRGRTAISRAQGLRAEFARGGVLFVSGRGRFGLSLAGYGRAGRLIAPTRSWPSIAANRATYRHRWLTEWYVNDALGIEQGFSVRRAPSGSGPLTLTFDVSGNMSVRLERNGALRLAGQGATLRYAGLFAADARGRTIKARLTLSGRRMSIEIDDAGARYPLYVDPFVQQAELSASDGAAGDQLGAAIAMSGDTIAVGAPIHPANGSQTGAVYVFLKPSSGWATTQAPAAELTASGSVAGDELGYSVAISGDTIVAGAPYHGASSSHLGAAYVYVEPASGWATTSTPDAELTAGDGQSNDLLGWSVAISGHTVVVGAPFHAVRGHNSQGAAYVYAEPSTGWATTANPSAELTASQGAAGDRLGSAVAIEGETVVAGALSAGSGYGALYVFVKPQFGWETTGSTDAQLTVPASDDPGGQLGSSVAISGNTIVAGAPEASSGHPGLAAVFVEPGTGWADMTAPTALLTASDSGSQDQFGSSVAVSGNTIVVGAPDHRVAAYEQGAAYVYVMPVSGWASTSSPSAELGAGGGQFGDLFGTSVAIDGDTLVGGAPNHEIGIDNLQGAAYVFTRPGPSATISSPADGATFSQNQVVRAAYSCTDDPQGSGLASCAGSVPDGAPLDTGTTGTHSFTVTAADNAGQAGSASVTYTVVGCPAGETGTPPNCAPPAAGPAVQPPVQSSPAAPVHPGPAPVVGRIHESHRTWRAGRKLAGFARARKPPIGTTFSFALSERATVNLAFVQRVPGHRVNRRCVAPAGRNRMKPRCIRFVAAGSLSFTGRAGANRVLFDGRLTRTKALGPGQYTLTIVATNAAGQRSAPRAVAFTMVP